MFVFEETMSTVGSSEWNSNGQVAFRILSKIFSKNDDFGRLILWKLDTCREIITSIIQKLEINAEEKNTDRIPILL